MYRCARIQGLDTVEGLLLFGRDHVYVVDGFTMLKTREIRSVSCVVGSGGGGESEICRGYVMSWNGVTYARPYSVVYR